MADLPKGERINIDTPSEKVCFDLEGFKALLLLDTGYAACSEERQLMTRQIEDLNITIEQLQAVNASKDKAIDMLEESNDKWRAKWEEENKLRHEAENIPQGPSFLPWAIAAAAIIAGGSAITWAIMDN